jgi:hypothetical protein
MMKKLFITSILLLTNVLAQAQSTSYHPYLNVGVSATSYRGDLTNRFSSWSSGFDAGILLNRKHRTNGYFHLSMGTVQGENSDYSYSQDATATPNTFFTTSYFSLGYEMRINVVKETNYVAYFSLGINAFRYNPRDQYKESYSNQFATRAKNETYGSLAFSFPMKIGGAYFVRQGYGIGAEIGFLNLTTDYIDNISEWGNKSKKDNLLQAVFKIYIPLKKIDQEHAGGQ